MTDLLRLALIGVGDVAYRDYLPAADRIAGLGRIEMVVSRDRARVEKAARDFGVPRAETDWRATLDGGIDVVVNLTPAPVHGEINLALAQAGRHFYSEKPLARDVAEGAAIRAAAAASGAVVAAAPSVMVYPQVLRTGELLADNEIGVVHSVRATATTPPPPWTGYVGDHGPFFSAEVGPLSDMGVYPLHAIAGLLGEIAEVAAASRRTRDDFLVTEGPNAGTRVPVDVDDNWQLVLSLRSGALASLQAAFCVSQPASCELEIAGETGTMTVPLLDPSAPLLVHAGGRTRDVAVDHLRTDGPDHMLGVRELLLSLREGREPVIGPDTALHVIAVRAAAQEAARSGRRIAVPPIGELGTGDVRHG